MSELAAAAERSWRRLDWDSDFFGFDIAEVDPTQVDDAVLEEVERQARVAGISCIYARHDASDSDLSLLLQAHDYRFVEAAMLFDINAVEPPPPCPEGVVVRGAVPEDRSGLLPIVDRMGDWSRFAADPHFGPEAAVRLQRAWLDRAIDDATGNRAVMVAEEQESGELVAFIGTVSEPALRIDAVGTTRLGSGAARYLVEQGRVWADGERLYGGPIAARNILALRFVAQSGLRVTSVDYVYHRWLGD